MARQGTPFEQRYCYKEVRKSDRALLKPAISSIGRGGPSKAAGMQVEKQQQNTDLLLSFFYLSGF